MEKRLIAALSVGLFVALLVIAFLAGRMTSTSSAPPAKAPSLVEREPQRDPPLPAVQQEEHPRVTPAEIQPPAHQDAAVVRDSSAPASALEQRQVSREPVEKSAIAAYFVKMDAIQVAGSGDPSAVAQGILGGIQSGDTSGLDALVDNAQRALAQATAVQPPPLCIDYHRRLLGVLSEEVAGVTRMRDAIKKGDMNSVTALGAQFQTTQQRVEDLERIRKQLLGQ